MISINVELRRKQWQGKALLGISQNDYPGNSLMPKKFLHLEELKRFQSLPNEKSKAQFLNSRLLAKTLLSKYLEEEDQTKIRIQTGIFNQPIILYPSSISAEVSISHCENISACIVSPAEHPMAIDIEKIDGSKAAIINSQLTPDEKHKLAELPFENTISAIQAWTAKEAISKVLKTGLTVPMEIFEFDNVNVSRDFTLFNFKNFMQYKCISFMIEGNICSVVLPNLTLFHFEH